MTAAIRWNPSAKSTGSVLCKRKLSTKFKSSVLCWVQQLSTRKRGRLTCAIVGSVQRLTNMLLSYDQDSGAADEAASPLLRFL